MAPKNNLTIVQQLIVKDLGLNVEEDVKIEGLEKLKKWLTQEIMILMERDFQKLLQILYRIDVNEQKAKKAFSATNPASALAELIIERELQKVESRKKYK